jgi:glycosyltransferase involved in cell wall biosynthesis
MQQKTAKIVMIAMFKNEAHVLKRMLDSVAPYIDFWVVQDNGSTDGSDQILKQWATETGIPGHYYQVAEGWKGFGWNRDHLIQTCQSVDHGCDWILKMDCDEYLEIDKDFDWTPINNTDYQAFHITAAAGDCMYYRAWMWNAKLQWRFNHDPCHETIYCADPAIDHAYKSYDLLPGFRQIGGNEGQSWSVPTKFISDALILEEKLIREQTMLENLYHFWYVGKSYFDAYVSQAFPLGEIQQREYARRAIFYFQEHINYTHDFRNTRSPKHPDETAYMGLIFSGECYEFLGETDSAILTYSIAGEFAPKRNDHLFNLARLYQKIKDYDSMLACTTIMMLPERTNPFPQYCSGFIDTSIYNDSKKGRVQELHRVAQQLVNTIHNESNLEGVMETDNLIKEYVRDGSLSTTADTNKNIESTVFTVGNRNKKIFVVNDFYSDPDAVRQFALTQVKYQEDLRFYKGLRSVKNYNSPEIRAAFEQIIGEPIRVWDEYGNNGCFQITTAKDSQVFHYDEQRWAAMIYLTPDAPIESGTRTHRSRINGTSHSSQPGADAAFEGNFYDGTRHDVVDSVGNVYNRLVIMDARSFHSAGMYFGNSPENGRLTHLFFFD